MVEVGVAVVVGGGVAVGVEVGVAVAVAVAMTDTAELIAKAKAAVEAVSSHLCNMGLSVNGTTHQHLDEVSVLITALQEENQRLREALTDIAHGNLGTKDPAGDGNTYILDGSEGLRFKEIARAALAGEKQ